MQKMYGSSCNMSYPFTCKDNMCHIQNETCFACQPGFKESTCGTSNTVFRMNIYRVHYFCDTNVFLGQLFPLLV